MRRDRTLSMLETTGNVISSLLRIKTWGCLTYLPAIVLGALWQKVLREAIVESVNGSAELMVTAMGCSRATKIDVLRTLILIINLMRALRQDKNHDEQKRGACFARY